LSTIERHAKSLTNGYHDTRAGFTLSKPDRLAIVSGTRQPEKVALSLTSRQREREVKVYRSRLIECGFIGG